MRVVVASVPGVDGLQQATMSTQQETPMNGEVVDGSESSNKVVSSLVSRFDELEDRVEELETEKENLHEELDEEREKRQRAEDVAQAAIAHVRQMHEQPTVEYRGEDSKVKNLWIGGLPIGNVADKASERSKDVSKVVFGATDVDAEDVQGLKEDGALVDRVGDNTDVSNGSAGLSDEVRDRLHPAHEMWMDIKQGRADRIPGDAQRRAARLFGRFICRASDEMTPVDASGQTYSLSSTDARDILLEDEDMTTSGASMTTKRAMKAVQRLTKTEDCSCSTVEECSHGLVIFDTSRKTNRLYTNKKRFNAAMKNVVAAIEGSVGEDADDPVEQAGEASDETDLQDEVDGTFDDLATAATDGGSNSVVSSGEGAPLGATDDTSNSP